VIHRTSDLRMCYHQEQKAVIQRPGTTPHGVLLSCMAGVLKRVEAEVRESAELWYA